MNPYLTPLAEGVWQVDLGYLRDGKLSGYLIVDDGEAALIDCGTAIGVPRWHAALDAIGIAPNAVRWVLPTHVHLDHAAAAGRLMADFANAELRVHPRGLRHLLDPSRLVAGTRVVYGYDAFERLFGAVDAVPAERADSWHDEAVIRVGQRELVAIHTPGHADHHLSVHDPAGKLVFAGDAFGVSYPDAEGEHAIILPSASPNQFRPEEMAASARRLVDLKPKAIGLGHFSLVRDLRRLLDQQLHHLDAMTSMPAQLGNADAIVNAILDRVEAQSDSAGTAEGSLLRDVWRNDAQIDAQGLLHWFGRQVVENPQ
ncbi:MBL fold metallo-hydrolase [Gammaproteobacteria bacterium]|nr:MBL fold metallo-hydrolase [Gammaproteobacteria bacterium]